MSLRDQRLKKGYTYHELAKKSGVNYQKIWQIEHDVVKSENIALKTAIKLAEALDCSVNDLISQDKADKNEKV